MKWILGSIRSLSPFTIKMFRSASPIDIVLNIYDIHESNRVLYNLGTGFFHSGVEVNGYEFSFSASGVVRTRPRLPEFGNFREQVRMGTYTEGMNGINNIISVLRNARFQPNAYNPIHLNCNHFSDAFCMMAVSQHIPDWVNRMAGIGANFAAPTSSASQSSAAEALPAPGVVKAPQLSSGAKQTKSEVKQAYVSSETKEDSSVISSIFGWLGWSDQPDSREGIEAGKSNQQPNAVNIKMKTAPSAKKELTEKQKELLAKMKS